MEEFERLRSVAFDDWGNKSPLFNHELRAECRKLFEKMAEMQEEIDSLNYHASLAC